MERSKRSILIILISMVILWFGIMFSDMQVWADAVQLDKSELTMAVGARYRLKISGTDQKPVWINNHPNVIELKDEEAASVAVVPKKAGKARWKSTSSGARR